MFFQLKKFNIKKIPKCQAGHALFPSRQCPAHHKRLLVLRKNKKDLVIMNKWMKRRLNEKNGMRNLVRRAAYTLRVKIFLYFCIKQNTNNKECNQNKSTIKISGRYVVIQKNKELSNNCTTLHIL